MWRRLGEHLSIPIICFSSFWKSTHINHFGYDLEVLVVFSQIRNQRTFTWQSKWFTYTNFLSWVATYPWNGQINFLLVKGCNMCVNLCYNQVSKLECGYLSYMLFVCCTMKLLNLMSWYLRGKLKFRKRRKII